MTMCSPKGAASLRSAAMAEEGEDVVMARRQKRRREFIVRSLESSDRVRLRRAVVLYVLSRSERRRSFAEGKGWRVPVRRMGEGKSEGATPGKPGAICGRVL